MKTRIISGICMAPLVIFVLLGGYWLAAVCAAVGLMGVREFFRGFEKTGVRPSFPIACASLAALYSINLLWPARHEYILAWLTASVMACSLYLFKTDERKAEDGMATLLGIVYVIFFPFHMVLTDQTGNYSILVWLVFIAAFATDTAAYFTGYFFGKHRLCPSISPKKTVEGAIGGAIGGTCGCALFGYFAAPGIWLHCLVIGFIGSLLSQLGDLTASVYKRQMGIKDYGNFIPGHGGIMDRFDSVLYTAPVVYYYIILVLAE